MMTQLSAIEKVQLLDAACRTDFVSFIQKVFHILMPNATLQMNFHIEALAFHLELVRLGMVTRLIINIPPRSLKSIVTSVAFPAFVLGHDPSKNLVMISYNFDLAAKHHNDCRTIMKNPHYQRIFPLRRFVKDTESEIVTAQGGFRFATSIDGTLVGRGGDIVVIDDPLSSMDALSDVRRDHVNRWFDESFPMRLNNKRTGAIIVVMQRLHIDDLAGMLQRSSEPWTVLTLSAIAEREEVVRIGADKYHIRKAGEVLHPERERLSDLEPIRSRNPELFAAHFQQSPLPPGGGVIKREWLRYYDRLPHRTASSLIIQSWDTASKTGETNDYSVCTTWLIQERKYYLIHVLREKLDYPELRKRAVAHAHAYKAQKFYVEDTGVGTGLIKEMKGAGLTVIAVGPERDKKTRLIIQSAKFESGLVFLPKEASWLADYLAELLAFPHVTYDDQVDSTSQALAVEYSTYDPKAFNKGMEQFISAMAFNRMFQ
jgi:predicted phage terminase large subunit-like protein